jgi:hypothetical protein
MDRNRSRTGQSDQKSVKLWGHGVTGDVVRAATSAPDGVGVLMVLLSEV